MRIRIRREEVSRGGQGLLRAEPCLPWAGADVLSPDSLLLKPGEGPSPRLALSLPLGAVMRPEPTGRRLGPAVYRKGGFLEVPPPPLSHPSQLCSWKLKELGSGTGLGVDCGPSRMPDFGSHHPQEGSVLLADRISVPAASFTCCMVSGKFLVFSRASISSYIYI